MDHTNNQHDLAAAPAEEPLEQVAADTSSALDSRFRDLLAGKGCSVPAAERRAISLAQLGLIVANIRRRLTEEGEVWRVTRYEQGEWLEFELAEPASVNLYDANDHVIKPATVELQLSLMEAMSEGEQIPDYFVSHFWGEPVYLFHRCLKRHCIDRGLEEEWLGATFCRKEGIGPNSDYLGGRSPLYWICAYANNRECCAVPQRVTSCRCSPVVCNVEHKLHEDIGEDRTLSETSFFRALELSKGTVSVVDEGGVSWTRVWCVYELYQSLTRSKGKTYDMYTALVHTEDKEERDAIGITQGAVAADMTDVFQKAKREQQFPIELLDTGINFNCEQGQASVEADRLKILAEIGTDAVLLNQTVHGVVAASALQRVLQEGEEERQQRYLEAVRRYPPPELIISLTDSKGDTEQTTTELVDALAVNGADKCKLFSLQTHAPTGLPESLGQLAALQSLSIHYCLRLCSLPESVGQLTRLTSLYLCGCVQLKSLPESIIQLTALQELNLNECEHLQALPESLGQLGDLQTLTLDFCRSLVSLPQSTVQLAALKIFTLRSCKKLASLPENMGQLGSLEYLNLQQCHKLSFDTVERCVNSLPGVKIDEDTCDY